MDDRPSRKREERARPDEQEADVDYEIEVEELKDRRRGFGRLAVGALLTGALVLVVRHFV
jgi:hypothetical protein